MFDDAIDELTDVAVTFRVPAVCGATTVVVVGEFNDWSDTEHAMNRQADGSMSVTAQIPMGRTYQYRYLIDGARWENDWTADFYAPNADGGDDSVIDLRSTSPRVASTKAQHVAIAPGLCSNEINGPYNQPLESAVRTARRAKLFSPRGTQRA